MNDENLMSDISKLFGGDKLLKPIDYTVLAEGDIGFFGEPLKICPICGRLSEIVGEVPYMRMALHIILPFQNGKGAHEVNWCNIPK